MNLRDFLSHQIAQTIPTGGRTTLWVTRQPSQGVFTEVVAADAIALTAEFPVEVVRTLVDNVEFRDTRAMSFPVIGLNEPITVEAEMNIQPAGTLSTGATLGSGDDPPQGDKMFRAFFGGVRLIDSQNITAINAVITSNRDFTHVDFGAGHAYLVGDACVFVSDPANVAQSGPAGGEFRRVTSVTATGLIVKPGFTQEPIVTGSADSIQGVRQYDLTQFADEWISARCIIGGIGYHLFDGKVNSLTLPFEDDKRKATFELMFLSARHGGFGMVRGVGGTDVVATGDLTLDVYNAGMWEVSSFVDLKEVTVATDVVANTEVALEVVARDTTSDPQTVTLGSRGGTVQATALLASTEGNPEELAGPYDLSTNVNLKFRIGKSKPFVTFDATSPTAPSVPSAATSAEVLANLNTQLRLHKDYGFATKGHVDVDWGSVFSEPSVGTLTAIAPVEGSAGQIEVVAAASLSLDSTLFTGPFTRDAVEEIHIEPHAPLHTEQNPNNEIHGKTTLLNWGSFGMCILSCTVTGSHEFEPANELCDSDDPGSLTENIARVWTIEVVFLQKQDAALFLDHVKTNQEERFHVQSIGEGIGFIDGLDAHTARILNAVPSHDGNRNALTLTLAITSTEETAADGTPNGEMMYVTA